MTAKIHLFPIIILIFCSAFPSFSQNTYSKEIEEKIKQVENNSTIVLFQIEGQPDLSLQERMVKYNVKGLSIAVVNNYQIEWAKGYGWADEKEKRPVTTETRFEPGSISKSLNALGVLKLVDEQKIKLCCADINDFLTSWKFPYDSLSKNKFITVGYLLSHTAGLNVHGFPGYSTKDKVYPTLPQILDGKPPANTEAVRSVFEPGQRFQYSGGGTTITQLMISDVTKTAYDKYMEQFVLGPIGMTNSSYTQPPPQNKKNILATGYDRSGKEIKGKYPVLIEAAAGGLWTTPTDLCKFIIEMQLSYIGKSNKVISQGLTLKMLTPYIDSMASFGVFFDNKIKPLYFTHSAGNRGFSGIYYGSIEGGNGVAIVINSENSNLLNELVSSVAKVYKWEGLYRQTKPVLKKVVATPTKLLKEAPGKYKMSESIMEISKKGNELFYNTGPGYWKMNFTSDSNFFNLESLSEKCFYFDNKGKVKGYIWKYGGQIKVIPKVEIITLPDTVLQKYVGNYLEVDQAVSFLKKGKNLYIKWEGGTWPVRFISDSEFYFDEQIGAIYQFYFDKGKVGGYTRKEIGDERKAPKLK